MNGNTLQATVEDQAYVQEMVSAAFGGDSAAFGKLVSMYQRPVYSICMRYLKSEDARDAAQEVFIKAFVHRNRFSADKSVLPWLLTIAKNLCIDKLRKHSREQAIEDGGHEPACTEPNAEQTMASKQTLALVTQEMQRLPEGQREAIILHHVDGLAYKEVSDVMGVPQGTVMTWLHRGRKTITKALHRSEKET